MRLNHGLRNYLADTEVIEGGVKCEHILSTHTLWFENFMSCSVKPYKVHVQQPILSLDRQFVPSARDAVHSDNGPERKLEHLELNLPALTDVKLEYEGTES